MKLQTLVLLTVATGVIADPKVTEEARRKPHPSPKPTCPPARHLSYSCNAEQASLHCKCVNDVECSRDGPRGSFNHCPRTYGTCRPAKRRGHHVCSIPRSGFLTVGAGPESFDWANEDDEATERTSLLRGGDRRGGNTFTGAGKRRHPDNDGTLSETDDPYLIKAYGDEQAWSSSLPQWTWIIQFLILVPINVIIVGQISLLLTAALNQTPADGNPPLPIYLFQAVLTILLLLPLTPFLHRFTYRIPTLLFLVFIGCLLYSLFAFPFSRNARLKVFFLQQVDLNTGINNVTVLGLDGYVQDIVGELPSAIGQSIQCGNKNLDKTKCEWSGLEPNVVASDAALRPFASDFGRRQYDKWLDYNVSHSKSSAYFSIQGRNTKHCHLVFDQPVSEVHIEDAASDPRYRPVHEEGSTQIRLFSRTWDKNFKVNVTWFEQEAKGQTGKVMCLWSDANQLGTIPAYDELRRFQPVWSATTKASDGLVEGWKEFKI